MARTDRFDKFIHSIDLICLITKMQQSAHFSQFSLTKRWRQRARERHEGDYVYGHNTEFCSQFSNRKYSKSFVHLHRRWCWRWCNHSNENVKIHTKRRELKRKYTIPFTRLMPHGTLFMVFVRNCFLWLRSVTQAQWHVTGISLNQSFICARIALFECWHVFGSMEN